MNIADLVKVMVAADGKIIGKTKIMKILFLLVDRYFPELKERVDFFPYQFGPYSTEIAKTINAMIKNGVLIPEKKGNIWEIRLSDQALEEGKKLLDQLEFKEDIVNLVKESNNESLRTLLAKIYTYYPEYAYNSRILAHVVEE